VHKNAYLHVRVAPHGDGCYLFQSDGGNDEVGKNFAELTDSKSKSASSEPLILLMKAVVLMKTNPK
jgi:hypothetical protein